MPPDPRARRIIADLKRDFALWREKVAAYEIATASGTAAAPSEDALRLEAEVKELAVDIESYVAEINYLGVVFDVNRLFEEKP